MALQYVALNRNCLRDVREHEEPHQLQLRIVQRPEHCRPWLDEQLAKIEANNTQSRHPRVTSQIDTALRILSGMQTTPPSEDPAIFLERQVIQPYTKDPKNWGTYPRDLVAKAHSVLAAMAHSRYRKCVAAADVETSRGATAAGARMRDIPQRAVREPGDATRHARRAADAGLFSRTVAMVSIEFRDVAKAHGIDITRDPKARFDALLCAVAEYQPRAYLEEVGNMLDDPQAGFGSPLCADPTCISYSRMRTPRKYPDLVRCTDGCPDAVHATYCSVECREKDAVRHATAA